MEYNVKIKFRLPTLPNYILSENEHGPKFAVGDLPLETIESIADNWKDELIKKWHKANSINMYDTKTA